METLLQQWKNDEECQMSSYFSQLNRKMASIYTKFYGYNLYSSSQLWMFQNKES